MVVGALQTIKVVFFCVSNIVGPLGIMPWYLEFCGLIMMLFFNLF
jgi:hypothetical protein